MIRSKEAKKIDSCVACGARANTIIWDHFVCYQCAAVWADDGRFGVRLIHEHLGSSGQDYSPETHLRYCVEVKRRTVEWAAERALARAR